MKPRSLLLSLALLLPLAGHADTPPAAPDVKAFGGRVTGEEHVSATVESVDLTTRSIVLRGPGGGQISFTVAPEVRNFAQMKAGDTVDMVTSEEVTIIVTNIAKEPDRLDTVDVARAAPGDKPGLIVVKRSTGVAVIEAIDYTKRTATLRGPQRTLTIEASPEAKNFKDATIGDSVLIDYIQTILITVRAGS